MGSGQRLLSDTPGRDREPALHLQMSKQGYQPQSELHGRVRRARLWEHLSQGVTFDKSGPRPGIPSSRIFCGSRCVTNASGTDAPWDFPGPPSRPAELVRVAREGGDGWGLSAGSRPGPAPEPQRPLAAAPGGAGLGGGGA